ncbi:MAG: hypothetical protein GQ551_14190 [Myxococcales bacterium]|jgi:hypothetical protein|nr:hypothetical protein [Myxococcales bacterium]
MSKSLRLQLPSLIEIDYRVRWFRHDEQATSRLVGDPGCLDVTGLGEGCGMLVERRDQRAPRKGRKGF